MNKFWKIFAVGLQNTLVYRWNFVLRTLFDVVPLVGTVFLWRALYGDRAEKIGGYDFGGMVYYFLLISLVSSLITPTDDEWQIAADIRDGQINSLLVKPISYLRYRTGLFLGYRSASAVFSLPIIILLFTYFHRYVIVPKDITTWVVAAFSMGMAAMLQFLLAYAIALTSFWILEISTIVFIVFSFEYFLSGHMFPLDLLPAWLGGALVWLPFTYELYFPVAVFQETVTGDRLLVGLCVQAGWVFAAWGLGRLMWSRGLRRFQAVGG